MATSTHNGSADQSLGELTKRLSDAVSRLVRKEAELARTELSEKAHSMAVGAGLAAGAGVLGLAALGALTAAAILALATAAGGTDRRVRSRDCGGGACAVGDQAIAASRAPDAG